MLEVFYRFIVAFNGLSLGRVVLYNVFIVFFLPKTLVVKTLAKVLAKYLATKTDVRGF